MSQVKNSRGVDLSKSKAILGVLSRLMSLTNAKSQRELAECIGLNYQQLNTIKRTAEGKITGKRAKHLPLRPILEWAIRQGVDIDYLLTGQEAPADRSLTRPEAATSLPILGDISAGHPLEPLVVIEGDQRRIHIPQSWLTRGPEAYFALVVNGSSMIGAGIEHGDLVVLEKTNHDVPVGRICAVQITGQGVALRRVYPRKGGELRLTADNPAVPEIIFGPEDDFEVVVLGQARWLFRGIGEEAVVLR